MNGVLRRRFLAFALVLPTAQLHAQAFPAGPITIVVPLAPGDAADISARAMGDEISRVLRTPVLVVNRPGGGGTIGANTVVQAAKNGHTLLFAQNSALTLRPVLDAQSVPYDTLRDLVPLGLSSRTPSVLVVRTDAPYKTFVELVEYAKKSPGTVRIGHPGVGSVGDLCVQLISHLAGVELVRVPYTGAGPSIASLRGEHIEGIVSSLGALTPHLRSGALRGIVASSRLPEFANIPTMRDLGYEDDLFGIWFSFLAPAGIPEATRKVLADAVEQAVRDPSITATLAPLGIFQSYRGPEQTAVEIREEIKRVTAIARKSGLVK